MAGVEVGPNDIVIHLVNPYRCGDCGAEFFLRTAFLEHVAGHIAMLKAEKPCHQIVCVTSLIEHAPKGITVTRDILQINEQQLFELQDPSLDYTQLSPLKALEQAGILKLPPPKPPQSSLPILVTADTMGDVGRRQVSLLNHQRAGTARQRASSSQRYRELTKELIGDGQLVTFTEGADGDIQFVSSDFSDPKVFDSIVQQAMLGAGQPVKVENGAITILPSTVATVANPQEPLVACGEQLPVEPKEEEQEKFISGAKKRATLRGSSSLQCPVCNLHFSTDSLLELHQSEVHSGSKLFPRPSCFKSFTDLTALKKHRLVHQRQLKCPICQKTYQRRAQLMFHMRHHNKQRFIQFGSSFHEVRVISSQNQQGQMVQEHYLLMLLSKEEQHRVELEGSMVLRNENNAQVSGAMTSDGIHAVSGGDEQQKPSAEKTNAGHETSEQEQVKEKEGQESKNNNDTSKEKSSLSALPQNNDSSETQDLASYVAAELGSSVSSHQSVEDTKKILYKCGHCKRIIFTRSALSRHLVKHTNSKPFQCNKCLKSFSDRADLVLHYKTHVKPFQCPTCHSSFSKSVYLSNHLDKGCPSYPSDDRIVVLEDTRCLCKICQKVLKSKTNAVRHLRIHDFQNRSKLREKSSENNKPEDHTNLSQNVEDHYQPLENSVGFQCLLCGEELRFKSFMITHVRRHLNQRLFKCSHCPKSFFARHILRKHEQNHTRPYKCPVCGKGFIRRYMMTKHFSKRHDLPEGVEDPMKDITELPDQKLIQCNICGKTMKQSHKSVMMYHIRLHKDVRPFKCNKCPKSFISDNALKKHSLTHSKPYVCQVCNAGFSRRYLLTDHFKKTCIFKLQTLKDTDAGSDLLQNNSFMSKSTQSEDLDEIRSEWQAHNTGVLKDAQQLQTNVDEYFCEPCSKKFTVYETYLRHIRTFSKPTACKYCKQLFGDKHSAVAHQRSCLGIAISEKASAYSMEQSSVASGGWQDRVKLMEEVNKTIETISAAGDKGGPETTPSSLPQSTHEAVAESKASKHGDALSRTVETLKSKRGKYPCPQCDRIFSTARGLKIHASVHVRLFKCEMCGIEFKTISMLRSHIKRHGKCMEVAEPNSEAETETNERIGYHTQNSELISKEKEGDIETTMEVGLNSEPEQAIQDQKEPVRSEGNPLTNAPNSTEVLNKPVVSSSTGTISFSRLSEPHQDCVSLKIPSRDESNDLLLMQQGTRGRPYRCQLCRKRFTEQGARDTHISSAHKATGV
ncbi:Zinc finger protein 420 [Plakobranchus ocellatus]|uniref:Zinc finger protein 420 n=1 Tax=Plakobranchus ocellatus TaxID=259542 RepID=A0AAV4DI04_9GAST|nr:Zinc finger protein 420 [Plakobranchus ocellatus]